MAKAAQLTNGRLNRMQRDVLECELDMRGLAPVRCDSCRRFLGYIKLESGYVMFKCKCGTYTEFDKCR